MSLQFLELEAGVLRMSWNPYQCSNENAFDQNFWNCGWLLTQLKQLLAQAGERESHIWTGIQSVKQHKSAPFLTCLFYWWLFFMLKIGRAEKKKELDCSIDVFPSSPLPYVRISCLSPLPKGLPHNCGIHPSHSHFRGSSVFQPLQFWDVTTAESQNSFLMAEHCTSCTLLIQSNRNTVLQGYLTQDQSNEIIVPWVTKWLWAGNFILWKICAEIMPVR